MIKTLSLFSPPLLPYFVAVAVCELFAVGVLNCFSPRCPLKSPGNNTEGSKGVKIQQSRNPTSCKQLGYREK